MRPEGRKVGLLLFALRLSRATVELRTSLRKLLRELSFSQTLTVLCIDKHEHCGGMFWHVLACFGSLRWHRMSFEALDDACEHP